MKCRDVFRGIAIALVIVGGVACERSSQDRSAVVDADADGVLDARRRGAARSRPCNSPKAWAETVRPQTGPAGRHSHAAASGELLFLTQTPGYEDVVALSTADLTMEVGRFCPAYNLRVGCMTHNELIDCNGLPTLFVATSLSDGWIRELAGLPWGSLTSARKCSGGDSPTSDCGTATT